MADYVEVYSVDSGKTTCYSKQGFFKEFGKVEGKEILQGHLPNLVAVEVDAPARQVTASLLTSAAAEAFQNKLYAEHDVVRLVRSPFFGEAGTYVWEVR